eukprot:snap_masked-scaffold49_size462716-processed-gene-3.20 protein:Tk03625 transcript:snap_masked-scaffold49_size462716-processed-gene-3.20-mRNA-1 annotation:"transmembrane protein 68-like isoform x1"
MVRPVRNQSASMLAVAITNEVWTSPSFQLHLLLLLAKYSIIGLTKLLAGAGEIVLCVCTFGGPLIVLVFVLTCNLYLLLKPFAASVILLRPYDKEFARARKEVCQLWAMHGELYHRFRVEGFEKIPDRGGAVIVYYHAAIPIDYIFLSAKLLLEKKRMIRSIVDKYMIWVPGFEMLACGFGCFAGTRQDCVKKLKEGRLIGIAPGGGYEAQCGSRDYDILWKKRQGFARIAMEANVPIIPVFTENIRETVINMQTGIRWWRMIYDKYRIPLVPLYGGFPVRLTMHIGDPIYPEEGLTSEDLRARTVASMSRLIEDHQETPGDIVRAVSQRIQTESDYLEHKYLRYSTRIRLNSEMVWGPGDEDHYEIDSGEEGARMLSSTFEESEYLYENDTNIIWMKERSLEITAYQTDDLDHNANIGSKVQDVLIESRENILTKRKSEDQTSSGFESMSSLSDNESV